MIRVKFFNSFTDSINTRNVFERIIPLLPNQRYGKDIVFTDNDDYTHAVILNTAMPPLTIPKENVIGLAFEPPYLLGLTIEFVNYAIRHIGRYYIGQTGNLPPPFMEHHGFMWYCPFPQNIKPKTKLMSIIFSTKHYLTGHMYRHLLINKILEHSLPIDIYGNGCETLNIVDSRIKGTFAEEEPYDGYQFTIAIENTSLNDYISEKCLNPLLYETTPLYYGAMHIDRYFQDHYIRLTGNVDQDLYTIVNVLQHPERYRKTINRYAVLNKMNIIDHLLSIFVDQK